MVLGAAGAREPTVGAPQAGGRTLLTPLVDTEKRREQVQYIILYYIICDNTLDNTLVLYVYNVFLGPVTTSNMRTHLSCLFLEAKALCSSSMIQLGGIGGCIILPRCGDPEELARGPRSGSVIEDRLSVALGRTSLGR